VRKLALVSLMPLALAACDLELDASREIPPDLGRRISQAKAELSSKPNDGALAAQLGELYLEAGQFFEAAEVLKGALDAGAETSAVHGALAEAYLDLGYFQAGADQLRSCFQKNRDEPTCLFVFGQLMEGIDDRQAQTEAQRSYRRLLQVAPDFRKAKLAKSSLDQVEARLGAMPAPAEAAAEPDGAAPSAPAANPHAGVAGAPPVAAEDPHAGVVGAPPVADGAADPHQGVDPSTGKEVGGLNPFGQAIMKAVDAVKRNDAVAAEAAFKDALKIRPNDPAALAGLAESEFAQGKKDAAAATIEKAYAADPKDPQVRWAFGRIMIDMRKRTEDAVAAWKSLVAEEPDYAKSLGIPERLEALEKYNK